MKLTKKLQALFNRWGTTIRDKSSVVRHLTYQTEVEIEPITFAVYETAIKAVYAQNLSCQPIQFSNSTWEQYIDGVVRHYGVIARKDGLTLPRIDENTDSEKARKDYFYCVTLLRRAGLYHDLLD